MRGKRPLFNQQFRRWLQTWSSTDDQLGHYLWSIMAYWLTDDKLVIHWWSNMDDHVGYWQGTVFFETSEFYLSKHNIIAIAYFYTFLHCVFSNVFSIRWSSFVFNTSKHVIIASRNDLSWLLIYKCNNCSILQLCSSRN